MYATVYNNSPDPDGPSGSGGDILVSFGTDSASAAPVSTAPGGLYHVSVSGTSSHQIDGFWNGSADVGELWFSAPGNVGPINITGSLLVSAGKSFGGGSGGNVNVGAGGGVGAITATGNIHVEAAGGVGTITAASASAISGASLADITVHGNIAHVVASAGGITSVSAEGYIGTVTAAGDIGAVSAHGDIEDISIGGSILGNISTTGSIGLMHLVGMGSNATWEPRTNQTIGIRAGQDINGTINTDTGLSIIQAGNNITSTITTQGGIQSIQAVLGGFNGGATASANIGDVSAGTSISASIQSTSGSIGGLLALLNISGTAAAATSLASVTAGGQIAETLTATAGSIGTVIAQGNIGGSISAGGGIQAVRSVLGSVASTITAGGSVGLIRAKQHIGPGQSITVTGSISDIISDTGNLHATVTATANLGNVTTLHGSINGTLTAGNNISDVWAGGTISAAIGALAGNIDCVLAGLDGGGDITGNISAGRTIGVIDARGIVNGDPNTVLYFMDQLPLQSMMDALMQQLPLPELTVPAVPVVTKGVISGNVQAVQNIGSVLADGPITGNIGAGGGIKEVESEGNISGNVVSQGGGVSVTAWGEITGDITALKTIFVNAVGSIHNAIHSITGGASVSSWGSIESQVDANAGIREWAFDTVAGTFNSLTGNVETIGIKKVTASGVGANVLLLGYGLICPAAAVVAAGGLGLYGYRILCGGQPIYVGRDAYVYSFLESSATIDARNVYVTTWGGYTGSITATGEVRITAHDNVTVPSVTSSGGNVVVHANNITGSFTTTGYSNVTVHGPILVYSGSR